MCGRYMLAGPIRLSREAAEVFEALELDLATLIDQREGQYNISPTQKALIVVAGEEGLQLKPLRWGFVPSWAKDERIGSKMINARAQTVAEKPAYRAALKKRRCLIPASGYYEWRGEAGSKQPFFIHEPNGNLMLFAGLWEAWRPSADAEWMRTFTIITGEPGKVSVQVHDRQPVVLPPEDWVDWLTCESDVAKDILDKTPDANLAFRAVSISLPGFSRHLVKG